MTLRSTTKGWKAAAEEVIDEGVRSGKLIIHDGKDFSMCFAEIRRERLALATRDIFLLNITKVGERACKYAANLVVVDFPEGVRRIGWYTFANCNSMTSVSFPTTLTSIGESAFAYCSSLDNVDLLHTNLRELDYQAFEGCSELKSMTIPDSLQTLGTHVFCGCSKLVPSNIGVALFTDPTFAEVVAQLRSLQN